MRIKSILMMGMITCVLFSAQVAQAFTDITNSQYKNAILDLQNRNIIQGYEDGSFQPNRNLARAELTKIILESLAVELEPASKCFPDVDPTQWYATYICTAKSLGWLEGYPNGEVRPANTIARSEALKIIALAEKWQLNNQTTLFSDTPANQWFTPYANTAKERNVVPFNNTLTPSQFVTRAEFAEIYHRILVTKENEQTIYQSSFSNLVEGQNTNNPTDPISSQANEELITTEATVSSGSYPINTFEDIVLNETLPNIFYKNEVYILKGRLADTNQESLFAFMYPEGESDSKRLFKANATDGNFEIPLHFNESGTYFIGVIPGESGRSKIAKITIRNELQVTSEQSQNQISGNFLRPTFDPARTYINFSSTAQLNKIDLIQNQEKVTYYNRQGELNIPVSYSDFQNFNKGSVRVVISGATAQSYIPLSQATQWQELAVGSFYATNHYFSEIDTLVQLDRIPLSFETNQQVTFSGTTNLELTPHISIITPDGFVEEYDVQANNFLPGQRFSYGYTPTENKTYIIEINKPAGDSAINHPIYPINQYPLLPDALDLNPLTLNPNPNFSESEAIAEMLTLINEARVNHGLNPVELNTELNQLAKSHNQDMITNEYVEHVNRAGQTPDDRRRAAGYPNPVGENIALTTSVHHGHEGFMRSAIHRRNILTPEWTQVGLSVLKNSEGYVYITQEFSLTNSDFESAINDLVQETGLGNNSELVTIAENWSQKMNQENFYGTENNGDTINTEIQQVNGIAQASIYVLRGSSIDALKANIESTNEYNDSTWDQSGIGFVVSDTGQVLMTIIFAR